MPFSKIRLSEKFRRPQKDMAREMPTKMRRWLPAGSQFFVLVRFYQDLLKAGKLRTFND
jgi:hypothetical protein